MKNKFFVLTGPSGAGEDSVIDGLSSIVDMEVVVTTTSRPMRKNESQGKPYYFITKEEFKNKLKEQKFFEWAEEDQGNLYGVTHEEIERIKKLNKPIIWKIDYKGAIVAKKLISNTVLIFIYIPLILVEKRLRNRGNMSEKEIQARLKYAQGWYDMRDKFDYEVENKEGKLNKTLNKVRIIIEKEMLKA